MTLIIRSAEIILLTLYFIISIILKLLLHPSQRRRDNFLLICGTAAKNICERLGPVFVKVGQSLSVRRDLLPEQVIIPLQDLQDRVSPTCWHRMKSVLEREYGCPLESKFDQFDCTPVACGSIAQVYRARLKGMRDDVAVKIKRPGIERIVDRDLRLICILIGLLQYHPKLHKIPIIQSVDYLCISIRHQLDFHQEHRNSEIFRRLFQDEKQVAIPQMISQDCRESILVMSFQQGLRKIDDLGIHEAVFQRAVVTLLRSLYKMIFTYGLIHCDFHPGNIFINETNQLVILDYGMTAQLTDNDRIQFLAFFLAIVNNDGKTCADIIIKTAVSPENNLQECLFTNEVIELVQKVSGQNAGKFRVADFIYKLFDIQRRYGLYGSPNFTMALVSLLMFEGIALHRFPTLDFQKEVRPFFTSGFIESVRRSFSSG